jgi:DNA-binding response OmpR family regulator
MDVLVVEDEALVRELVCETLLEHGLEVAEAPSAEQALALTEQIGAPEVVVTDVQLGVGMAGLALAQEVRRRWPEAAVVVMTGTPLALNGHPFGEREHLLTKPFRPSKLVATVRQLMGRSER